MATLRFSVRLIGGPRDGETLELDTTPPYELRLPSLRSLEELAATPSLEGSIRFLSYQAWTEDPTAFYFADWV